MKLKTSVSLMVAVVLGLVTAKVGIDMMRKYRGNTGPGVRVVMAKKDMDPGYVIEADDVELTALPAGVAPAKALRDLKDAVGRTVLATVVTGYPLADNLLAPKGAGAGLQAMVPKGMRAVTIDVSDSSSVANMLTPGCNVDVVATLRKGDQSMAKTIVSNVKVQYIQRQKTGFSSRAGQTSSIDNGPIKTVTLIVTPKQAATVDWANNNGAKPRLVLRGNLDTTTADDTVTENEILGLPDAPPKAENDSTNKGADDATFANVPATSEPDKGRAVQIIRAGQESTIYYPQGNKEEGTGAATPTAQEKSKRPGNTEPRTASGKSPESSAPRTDARPETSQGE